MIPRDRAEAFRFFVSRHRVFLACAVLGLLGLCAALLLTSGRSADTLYRDALEAASRGDLPGALEILEQLTHEYPGWKRLDEACFRTGSLRAEARDLQGALAAWDTLVRRFPESPVAPLALERMADLLYDEIGDRRQAVALWKRLVTAAPQDPRADRFRFRISGYLLTVENPESALFEFRPLLDGANDPHLRNLIALNLATLHFNRKNMPQAEALLAGILAHAHCPSCSDPARVLLADIFESEGRLREAAAALEPVGAAAMGADEKTRRLDRIRRKADQEPPGR
ncbi:MAG: tetratricopeptide repeat protein [Acidobacteria bacterium]|nr:tetratricopeptide repeat protein [Acidobacteriota bacterium]